MMKTNQAGKDFIKSFETLELKAYQDAVGRWTIGYGHTSGTHAKRVISKMEADYLFDNQDLPTAERAINKGLGLFDVQPNSQPDPVTQNQFNALVDFIFNVGVSAFLGSTLLKKILDKDMDGAANEFVKWDHIHIDGTLVENDGLKRRRLAEKTLFEATV